MLKNILILSFIFINACEMNKQLPGSGVNNETVMKQSMIVPVSDANEELYQEPLVAVCTAEENPVEPGQIVTDTCYYNQKFKVTEVISGKIDSSFSCTYFVNVDNEQTISNNKKYIFILQDTKAEGFYNLLKVFKDIPENRNEINRTIQKFSHLINFPVMQENISYSVIIDIYTKGTYKVYSNRIVNGEFEAIKYSTNNEPPQTIVKKDLTRNQAKEFEDYILSFPIDSLRDKYIDNTVEGEHHLQYSITIGEKHKDIYVYFKEQKDLKLLYEKLNEFIPAKERFWYY